MQIVVKDHGLIQLQFIFNHKLELQCFKHAFNQNAFLNSFMIECFNVASSCFICNIPCPQQAIREGAVEALRACLVILAQRETKEMQKRPIWYNVSLKHIVYIVLCDL